MREAPHQIRLLFVSRRDTVRSILAQAALNHMAKDRFKAFSCGNPRELGTAPHPLALEVLNSNGIPARALACTPWDRFARASAPKVDFVITLADELGDAAPRWPGQPDTALWSLPDWLAKPAPEADLRKHLLNTLHTLRRRLELFTSLPLRTADRAALRADIRDIGRAR
jgi:protein-tyrosine-phosphatase